jgi:nucleoside-diphosphate-sugar epimerase
MKHILVTGAAGFIGSHLSEALLAGGYQVTGIDNFDPFYNRTIKEQNLEILRQDKHFDFIEGDIADASCFDRLTSHFDAVIHLAAKAGVRPSIADPAGYIRTNITGTQNILNWMRSNDIKKFVFASSSSVYGNNKKIPFAESDSVDNPISPYAFTKKSGELMNFSFHHLYKIDIVNLRFFTVYGPRQRPDLAIHKFIDLIDKDQAIPVFGKGDTYRDYTYIKDIVTGIIGSLDYVNGHEHVYEIFNIGNNQPVSLMELITTLYRLMGKEPRLEYLPMQPGDVDRTYASIDKAQQLLGYSPSTSIEDGLQQFIEWYYQRKNSQPSN